MNAIIVLAAAAAFGVDVGWRPLSEGGVEYIIQIEPELLNTLSAGQDLTSDVPSSLDVRRYRITVGNARLPQANEDGSNGFGARAVEPAQPEPAVVEPDSEPPVESTAETEGPAMAGPAATESDEGDARPAPARAPADVATARTPRRFSPDVESAPLGGRPATYDQRPRLEQETLKPALKSNRAAAASADSAPEAAAAKKPWMPLTVTLLGFFLSLGGNVYLGWLFWDARNRYRGLLASFQGRGPQAA